VAAVPAVADGGFDEFGYNYNARIFNGLLGNADENRPGGDGSPDTLFGADYDKFDFAREPYLIQIPVAGTHLVMKWSKAWHMAVYGPDGVRYNGDEEPWNEDAWLTNTDVWTDDDGRTHTAFFYVRWTGSGGELWGQFTIVRCIVDGKKIR